MNACVIIADPCLRKIAESALRRLGCKKILHSLDDTNALVGDIQYAVIQVFDNDVESKKYTIDESCPLIQRVRTFVDEHPECYVVAVTHKPCVNDGRMAVNEGNVDWWITDTQVKDYLPTAFCHAYLYHHAMKGFPAWRKKLSWINRHLRRELASKEHRSQVRALRRRANKLKKIPA